MQVACGWMGMGSPMALKEELIMCGGAAKGTYNARTRNGNYKILK